MFLGADMHTFCENANSLHEVSWRMFSTFRRMDEHYKHSFKSIGGEYVKQDHEATCAIRLPRTLFFGVGAVNAHDITCVYT